MVEKSRLSESVFIPGRESNIKNLRALGLMVILCSVISITGSQRPFSGSILIFSVLFLSANIFLPVFFMTWYLRKRGQRLLQKLAIEVDSPTVPPVAVYLEKATFVEKLSYQWNGRTVRAAVDFQGKKYRIQFNQGLDRQIQGMLYRVKSEEWFGKKFFFVPVEHQNSGDSKKSA